MGCINTTKSQTISRIWSRYRTAVNKDSDKDSDPIFTNSNPTHRSRASEMTSGPASHKHGQDADDTRLVLVFLFSDCPSEYDADVKT